MKIDLSGKTAVVTGSSAGIGFAIAKGLAGTGARVIVNSRHDDGIKSAIAKIKDAVPGAKLEGVAADVATARGCDALVKAVPETDILVNNAGGAIFKDFFETTDEDWIGMVQWNVMSGVRLSRAYMKAMLAKNWGRIVFISSEVGAAHPQGHDPLRHGESLAACRFARPGGAHRRDGRDRERRAAGPDEDRAHGRLHEGKRRSGRYFRR